jgi:uncharacterized protein YkwD
LDSFNLVDALLALVVLAGAAIGWRRGFLLGTLGLGVLVASVLLAIWGHAYAARALESWGLVARPWSAPAAFIGTFIVLRIVLGAVANLLVSAIPQRAHGHVTNRALGLAPGFADGLIHAMIVALLLRVMPFMDAVTEQTRESEIAARLAEPAEWLESRLTPIFQEAADKTRKLMIVQPGSKQSIPLAYTIQDARPRPDLEARMLLMINEERAAQGIAPLRADPELTAVARAHSRDMFARGYFSHVTPDGKDPFDRIRQAKVNYLTAGENIALAPTLPLAHQGLMKSPGHRANILRPAFGRVGIGIVDGGRRGEMVTQNFRN